MSTRARNRLIFVGSTLLYIVVFQLAYVAVVAQVWRYASFSIRRSADRLLDQLLRGSGDSVPLDSAAALSSVALALSISVRTRLHSNVPRSAVSRGESAGRSSRDRSPGCRHVRLHRGARRDPPSSIDPLSEGSSAASCILARGRRCDRRRRRPGLPCIWCLASCDERRRRAAPTRLEIPSPRRSNNTIVGYALNWPSYVVNPLLLAVGLWYRRRTVAAIGIGGQAFAYAVNAARGPLATVPVSVLLWFSLRQRRLPFGVFWMVFFALIAGASLVAHWAGGLIEIAGLVGAFADVRDAGIHHRVFSSDYLGKVQPRCSLTFVAWVGLATIHMMERVLGSSSATGLGNRPTTRMRISGPMDSHRMDCSAWPS